MFRLALQLGCCFLLGGVAEAAEEVAIEVPASSRYSFGGDGLAVVEASGERVAVSAPLTFELCGDELCPPMNEHPLPVKVAAKAELTVNGRRLKGALWVTVQKGHLMVVNRLSLEEYLVATVGSEMPKSFPLEALKAQAVAARTFAMARKILRAGEVVELSSTTLDQVYGGLDHESAETRSAVAGTSGEILVFEREPIDAFFFASCIGHTRDGKNVFGVDRPYLRSVDCGLDNASAFAWRATLSRAQLERELGLHFRDITLTGQASDGRVAAVTFLPSNTPFAPEVLRKHLGYTVLKSADFTVSCTAGSCTFNGHGNGHGVGMCQWGARSLALQGKDYQEILAHYFPGAELKKLY